jgi:hypothetical protein
MHAPLLVLSLVCSAHPTNKNSESKTLAYRIRSARVVSDDKGVNKTAQLINITCAIVHLPSIMPNMWCRWFSKSREVDPEQGVPRSPTDSTNSDKTLGPDSRSSTAVTSNTQCRSCNPVEVFN